MNAEEVPMRGSADEIQILTQYSGIAHTAAEHVQQASRMIHIIIILIQI